jgi:hypothetical protein
MSLLDVALVILPALGIRPLDGEVLSRRQILLA